jgi:demethylmenaquinone methyltransferase / 2-methoxy-6-polyprenyl-1,4-benzoquinol methylase
MTTWHAGKSHADPEPSRVDVWKMFDRVAGRYDFLNRCLSLGVDRIWRTKMAAFLPLDRDLHVLDLATGTGDQLIFLFERSRRPKSGIGMDLAEKMLEIGRRKIAGRGLSEAISLKTGNAMDIPAKDNAFDAVTMSFGIRNMTDVNKALREMHRVLKRGGRMLILEFSIPGNRFFRTGYLLYLRHILPRIGAFFSGDAHAYRYLNQTIETFPEGEAFCKLLKNAGFAATAMHPLTFGIATIYQGDKPRRSTPQSEANNRRAEPDSLKFRNFQFGD